MKKLMILAGALCMAWPAIAGGVWGEIDAGPLPPGEMTMGEGNLGVIRGSLSSEDLEDMYCITITDVAGFSATTVGGADWDTQLFLFDVGGMGVTFDDDDPGGGGLQSTITGTFVPGTGTYYLAISSYDNDALSAGGEIWLDGPFTEERAPDGPGAGSPITGWDSGGTSGAGYSIALTGAGFCMVPEPGTFVALGVGLAALVASRRRR
ncbi:MAG: PEP-CTERM sorting domain-containing protein [Armatimonadetes bacterium]|nr:PEP-CTERM sorting domain-containing protein [Armatimonadota bacterium]